MRSWGTRSTKLHGPTQTGAVPNFSPSLFAWVGDTGDLTNPVILTQPVPESDAGTLVAEIEELMPPTSPYFVLNPWLGPDFVSLEWTIGGVAGSKRLARQRF